MTRQIIRIPRPPEADEKLESFTTWCGETPPRVSRGLRLWAWSCAAVASVVVAVAVAGWL